jgi:hypothetical protein
VSRRHEIGLTVTQLAKLAGFSIGFTWLKFCNRALSQREILQVLSEEKQSPK